MVQRLKDQLPKNTAKMEERIVKLNSRVKKINDNPDPSKPKANAILYQMEADAQASLLKAWKTGNPPLLLGDIVADLGRAMGFMHCDAIQGADRSDAADAKKYFDMMERLGYNENACDRTIAIIPMIQNGDWPPPDVIVSSNFECMPVVLAFDSLAHLLGVPLFQLDRPPAWSYKDKANFEKTLAYVTKQIEEMIDFFETRFPGVKYDQDAEAKLSRQLERNRIWYGYQRDIYQLRKRIPCPLSGRESFREVRQPNCYPNPDMALEYARIYRDQLYENADKGITPCGVAGTEEKLRLLWAVSGFYYYDPFAFLEKLGISVPCWIVTDFMEKHSGRELIVGDEVFGRKLSPLEEVARRLKMGWGDHSDYYVNSIVTTGKELAVDGIVYFMQPGCTPTQPLGQIVSDRAEAELGIPTMIMDGRQLDQRGFNQKEYLAKLVDFANICLARKHLPSLTRAELEKAGFYN